MWVGGQRHTPAALPVVKRPGTHFTGGWGGGSQVLSGQVWKISPSPGFDHRTVRPLASRIDYAIRAHVNGQDLFETRFDI
jgi:hypothetical protein